MLPNPLAWLLTSSLGTKLTLSWRVSITSKQSCRTTFGMEHAPCTTGRCSTLWMTSPLECLTSSSTITLGMFTHSCAPFRYFLAGRWGATAGLALGASCVRHQVQKLAERDRCCEVKTSRSLGSLRMGPFAALRFTVNLARFTKARDCISCFGSTISGTRPFTKSWICIAWALHPGTVHFNFRTAYQVTCWLCFPSSPFFIISVLLVLRVGGHTHDVGLHLFDASCQWVWCSALHLNSDSTHSLIRCTSPMSLMLGSSIRFIFPSPPFYSEFVAAAILLL